MPAGRPTKYDPEFHPDSYLGFAKEGWTIYEVCREWNIAVSTFYEWVKHNEEFSKSHKTGRDHCQGWFHKSARENLENKNYHAILWSMKMKVMFNSSTHDRIHKIPGLDKMMEEGKGFAYGVNCVLAYSASEGLSADETSKLIGSVKDAANVSVIEEMRKELDELKENVNAT